MIAETHHAQILDVVTSRHICSQEERLMDVLFYVWSQRLCPIDCAYMSIQTRSSTAVCFVRTCTHFVHSNILQPMSMCVRLHESMLCHNLYIDLPCDKCPCLLGASNWRQLDKQEGVIFPSRHHTHTFALRHPQPCRSSPILQYLASLMSVLLLPWTCQCDGWSCMLSLSVTSQ